VKPPDTQTNAELKDELLGAATKQAEDAKADSQALFGDSNGNAMGQALGSAAREELVAANPALDDVLDPNHTQLPDGAIVGTSAFDEAFESLRRQVLMTIAESADQAIAIVLQEAVDLIDDLRALADQVAIESAKLVAAAATGLLVPPSDEDIEGYRDEVEDAQDQAVLVQRDLANAQARRRALNRGELIQTTAPTEPAQDDEANSFAAPGNVSGDPARTTPAAEMLQDMLRAPILDRIGYVVICSALSSLSTSQETRLRAERAALKLKTVMDQIRAVLEVGFLETLQQGAQERANTAIANVVSLLQSRLDAIDGFLRTRASLPGPFVTTVQAIGDVGDQTPLLNGLGALCGLKGQRFCDFQGLLEIAASLDADLGLKFPKLPMVGRIEMTLAAPEAEVPRPVIIPGQEADLLLVESVVELGVNIVRAKFRYQDRISSPVAGQGNTQAAMVFGTGGGTLILSTPGTQVTETVTYSGVTYSNGVYSFTLTAAPSQPVERWAVAPVDEARLTGWTPAEKSLDDAVLIKVRSPQDSFERDLSLPTNVVIGFGETWSRNGFCRRSGDTNEIEANAVNSNGSNVFRQWMVGLTININGSPVTIVSVVLGGDGGRDIAIVSDASSLDIDGSGTLDFSFSLAEERTITAMAPRLGSPTTYDATITSALSRDHDRLLLTPAPTVKVVPTLRGTFLDEGATAADDTVRANNRLLPAGATVVRATFADPAQELIFKPILLGLGSGTLNINGSGDLPWSSVTDQGGSPATLRFVMATPTTTPHAVGVPVEVETTSLLDQFKVQFPSSWSDPIDDWLAGLLVLMNRLESQFCRLLSGSPQNIAVNAGLLAAQATAASFLLTSTRFLLVAWLTPLLTSRTLADQVAALDALGATRAASAVREGRLDDFAAMTSAEGTEAGASEATLEAIRQKAGDENTYRAVASARDEIAGQHLSAVTDGIIAADIQTAQREYLERRRQGAENLKRKAEEIPV